MRSIEYKSIYLIGIIILSLILITLIWFQRVWNKIHVNAWANCPARIQTEWVRGHSMEPLIKDGIDILVDYQAYNCGEPIRRGDIIIFRNSAVKSSYIKAVRAIPGDIVTIDNSLGTLTINDILLTNSAWELYRFNKNELNFLSLFVVSWRLQSDAYFVFGDNTKQSEDSRKIGAISASDILGKVVKN